VVVFVELRDDKVGAAAAEVIAAVRDRLHTGHQIARPVVVLGRAGLVRKTTSGKVRRRACRQDYLGGVVATGKHTIAIASGSSASGPHTVGPHATGTGQERGRAALTVGVTS
jgi:hypothetical protein